MKKDLRVLKFIVLALEELVQVVRFIDRERLIVLSLEYGRRYNISRSDVEKVLDEKLTDVFKVVEK